MGQGNNKDSRLVALHTGVTGDVGLAMLVTQTPPVTFKLERTNGGPTALAAKSIIQGKLRLPSTLEQYLHGGQIVGGVADIKAAARDHGIWRLNLHTWLADLYKLSNPAKMHLGDDRVGPAFASVASTVDHVIQDSRLIMGIIYIYIFI